MIIQSILDTDLYKLTMQNFVLRQYPEAIASYKFYDRNNNIKIDNKTFNLIKDEIKGMKSLKLTDTEYDWVKEKIYFFDPMYRQYLSSFRYNPNLVNLSLDKATGKLDITVEGKWREAIMWEVPLMSIISELYFREIDRDWEDDEKKQINQIIRKAKLLSDNGCRFADFGTRRRRNFKTQQLVVNEMQQYDNFMGSSNILLSMQNNTTPIGTQGHEIIQAVSVLEGLRHANRFTMQKWQDVFHADLGIMLTDTFGFNAFLNDFSLPYAKMWDGVRHDSGCPFAFTDKIIEHYKKLKIDPITKTIVFSDGLTAEKAVQIKNYCEGDIKCSFGIGTNFTSDFLKTDGTKSNPLNIVIKLDKIDGIPVVKLSDTPTKAVGNEMAKKVAMWTFFGEKIK